MNPLWRKEWHLQSSLAALWLRLGLWLALALFFLSAYQQYQSLALQLAQLENRRGATQMLLLPVNQLLLNAMLLWTVFFGARALAQEYEWQTLPFAGAAVLWRKALILWLNVMLLSLPFWLSVGFLGLKTDWDKGLLYGMAAAQIFLSLYALALVWLLSLRLRHSVTTALAAAVLLLLLWLSPLLIYEPAPAADIVRWLSPFSHAALFTQGIFHVQTAVFVLLHVLFFGSCFILMQQENR